MNSNITTELSHEADSPVLRVGAVSGGYSVGDVIETVFIDKIYNERLTGWDEETQQFKCDMREFGHMGSCYRTINDINEQKRRVKSVRETGNW